jgi:hypothetical protein
MACCRHGAPSHRSPQQLAPEDRHTLKRPSNTLSHRLFLWAVTQRRQRTTSTAAAAVAAAAYLASTSQQPIPGLHSSPLKHKHSIICYHRSSTTQLATWCHQQTSHQQQTTTQPRLNLAAPSTRHLHRKWVSILDATGNDPATARYMRGSRLR